MQIVWKELKKNDKVYKEKWPFLNDVKGLSPSTLTKPLALLVYGLDDDKEQWMIDIIKKAQLDGQEYEKAVQHYLTTTNFNDTLKKYYNNFNHTITKQKLLKTLKYLYAKNKEQNIKFKDMDIKFNRVGYAMYKDTFIACENDIEFEREIWECKKTNLKYSKDKNKEFATLLMYEIQCYMQHLCFNKKIKYLWALTPNKLNCKEVEFRDDIEEWIDYLLSIKDLSKQEMYNKILYRITIGELKWD